VSVTGGDSSLYQPGGTIPPVQQRFDTILEMEAGATKKMEINLVADTASAKIDAAIEGGMKPERQPTTPSRPTLEFPIYSLRELVTATAEEAPEEYLEAYQSLRDLFPEDIRQRFEAEMERKHDERSDEMNALHRGLAFLAEFMIGLKAAAAPFAPGAAALNNIQIHMALPLVALQEATVLGNAVLQEGMRQIRQQGTGSPFHDELLGNLKRARAGLKKLEEYKTAILEGKATEQTYKEMGEAAARINNLADEFERQAPGPELTIIGPLLRAMALSAASQSLPGGLKPLSIGLALASVGLYSESSRTGLIQKGVKKFLEESFGKISGGPLKELNAVQSALFGKLAETAVIGALIGNSLLLGIPQDAVGEERLLSALFIGGVIQHQGLITAAFPHRSSEKVQSALEFLAMTLTAKMAQAKNGPLAEAFLKANLSSLSERIGAVDFGPFTTQAKLALREESLDAYMAAFDGALKEMEIAPDDFAAEMKQLINQTSTLYDYLTPDAMDDQTNTLTGMTQI